MFRKKTEPVKAQVPDPEAQDKILAGVPHSPEEGPGEKEESPQHGQAVQENKPMTALDPQETMAQVMEHLMQEEEVGRCLLQLVEDEWNVRKVEHLYIIHHYGLDEKRHLTREELIKLSRWVATDDRVKG